MTGLVPVIHSATTSTVRHAERWIAATLAAMTGVGAQTKKAGVSPGLEHLLPKTLRKTARTPRGIALRARTIAHHGVIFTIANVAEYGTIAMLQTK